MSTRSLAWHSLKNRVTVFTLSVFVLGIWSLSLYSNRMLQTDMERLLGEQQLSVAATVAQEVDDNLNTRMQALQTVAEEMAGDLLSRPKALQTLLERHPVLRGLFNGGVWVVNADATVIADVPVSAQRLGISYQDRDFVVQVLKQGKPLIGPPLIGKQLKSPLFAMMVPLRDAKGVVIGALAGVTNLGKPSFLDSLQNQPYGESGGYILVDPRTRTIITGTDKKRVMEVLPAPGINRYVDRNIAGYEGYSVLVNALGEEQLASVKRVPAANWYILLGTPTAEAFAPLKASQQRMLLATLLLTLLIGAITWWILNRQLAPLLATADAMDALASAKQIPQPLPVSGDDEIGKLVGGFNRLITTWAQREEALRISATAFESQQGMIISNAQRVILRVNQAFTTITGYSADDAVGKNQRVLASDRHDRMFYAAMSKELQRDGKWAGEIWTRRKSGEVYSVWLTISAVKDSAGVTTHYVDVFNDLTERVSALAQIDTLAFYDTLTKLPNRRLLLDRLDQALHVSTRHARKNALLMIDLDDFRTLNDTMGHNQGDLLLEQVAQRLRASIREGDTAARLASDEFVVMLEDLSEDAIEAATQAESVGEKILAVFAQGFTLEAGMYHGSASIGVSLFGGDVFEAGDQPLKRAELAMFQAKAAGRNTLRFFDTHMQAEVSARALLEADLREAVLKQQFLLYYQPQVVGGGRVTGVEALVRWQHPTRGMVSPAEFIPSAEETGLILSLGQWVLEAACAQLAEWAQHPELAHLTMAVNVSARQFQQSQFVDSVLTTLARTGAKPRLLKLELTESMLLDDVEKIITKMGALKASGVTFSLDDFGTGYSSLTYLKRLPLDQLKIDQGFVRNIVTDPNDAAIAKMVVALAESMGLSVIAEGVELQAQADFLAHLGCHAYQGYLFSRPLSPAALDAFVRRS